MDRLHELRKIPFVRLSFPLVIGLIAGLYFKISVSLIYAGTCFLAIYYIIILFINIHPGGYEFRMVFGICINIFMIVTGFMLIKTKSVYPEYISAKLKTAELFLCRIINQPEQKSETVRALLRITGYGDSAVWYKCRTDIIAYFQMDSNTGTLSGGNVIILKSRLREINNPGNPCEFDYRKSLKLKGITFQSYVKTGAWQTIGQFYGIRTFAAKLRNNLLDLYRKYGINDNEFAVLSALTLGYRNELNPEIKSAFISAGAMHFLAVSGLHVGVIFCVLNILLGFCGGFRYGKCVRLIIIIIILWFYALLTGLPSSVIRASAMFSVIQAGLSLNRKINIFNIVFFTAFSILVARPSEISNPGFQLSFIAVLGIVYFQPFFYRLFVFKNLITDKLWMLFTVSVSAELGVFPIIIYYFHNFPVYFWLSNLLLIFPLALAIYLAILLFIFCQFSQIAFIIATVLNFLIKLINSFILKIEKLPGSLVENIYNNASETALLYMFIISVSIFIILKNRKYLSVSLFCMLCFLAVNFTRVCKIYRQNKIIVFNLSKHTAVNLITGRNSYLLTDLNPGKGMSTLLNTVRPCWLQYGVNNAGKIINTENIPDDLKICDDNAALCVKKIFNNIFIIFRDRNLLILSDSDLFEYETGDKYRLDYLIISGNLKCRMDAITAMFDADKIIIDSSNDFLARRFWEKECEAYGIDCYIISDEGAFEMEL